MKCTSLFFFLAAITATLTNQGSLAFVPPTSTAFVAKGTTSRFSPVSNDRFNCNHQMPVALQRQRRSVTNVQTQSLFGLGPPELAIILIAAVFLIGPQKIAEIAKDSGKMASELQNELREVPEEFQKGMAEGEMKAKSAKAKPMSDVPEEDTE